MTIQTFDSSVAVAEAAARMTIDQLNSAIAQHGSAVWVLAGGSTPNLAYEIIADGYLDQLDWSNITFIIGDERIGPLNGPDNNWQGIEELFLQHIPEATFIRPKSDLPAEQAAADYEQRIQSIERFDVTWLGMGPDGHTLSLFPNHPYFNPNDTRLVIPFHNSPKPPSDRISLTLAVIKKSQNTFILATGDSKRDAFQAATQSDSQLPIALAAKVTNAIWLTDIDK